MLSERFHVPDSRLSILTDESATREAIISHFLTDLVQNPNIERDDTIIFYYAGRGSRAEASQLLTSQENAMETLCPHDEWSEDDHGLIPGIPGRTMNALFRELARVKGDNIVRISDI